MHATLERWARLAKPGVGAGGSKSFFGGLFALVGPSAHSMPGQPFLDSPADPAAPRESNFSLAARRSARARFFDPATQPSGADEHGVARAVAAPQAQRADSATPLMAEVQPETTVRAQDVKEEEVGLVGGAQT